MNAISGSLGHFTYPPPNSDLQFDYSDSVVTSWVTNDSYPTEAVLTLWFYQTNWTLGVIEIVPANGSRSVALDIDIGDTADYIGQFHIYYNAEDGRQKKYDSSVFHVVQDTGEISPVTYNQQALSTSLVAHGTPSTLQATPTNSSTFDSATTSALTSTATSQPSSQGSHLATKFGLGIGIAFAIAAMGLISFLYWKKKEKKKNSVPRNSFGTSQRPGKVVNQGPIRGELDGHQRDLELPVGPLDAELEGSRPAP